jgi:hypothetical protein
MKNNRWNIRRMRSKRVFRWRISVRAVSLIRCPLLANIQSGNEVTMAYPGGKAGSGAYQKIINQVPPHRVYIEPFLGAGAVMRHKRPAQISYGLDIDSTVVQAWQAALSAGTAQNCEPAPAGAPIAFPFDAGHQFTPGLIVEKRDAISFLRSYDWQGDEFVYCDPPYLKRDIDGRPVRKSQADIYAHEFYTIELHTRLLKTLRVLPCPVAISGYWSQLYHDLLPGWRTINFQSSTRGGSMATEWVWMNYPEPDELHDYRYLGDNFRQRERFNRIRKNMLAKLARMDQLERFAILSSIAEFRDWRR